MNGAPLMDPAELAGLATLAEIEERARERLHPGALDYVAGGSWDETTLAENAAAFRRRRFRGSVLHGVQSADLGTSVLGLPAPTPFGVAPMAQYGFCHPDGEVPAAQAAAQAGWTFAVSTLATRSLEEIASVAGTGPGRQWFQLYVQKDLGLSRSLVERAEAAGYGALVVTVDLPVIGYRDRDLRGTGLALHYGNMPPAPGETDTRTLGRGHPPLTWGLIDEVRSWTRLPLLVKGILEPGDAVRAVEHGAQGIVVSNHGGRQLDRVPAAIDALPGVVTAVGDQAEVFLDGGVRRGLDVVMALALGARAVFVGRPILHGVAIGGEAGVLRVMEILRLETQRAMVLLGAARVADLEPGMLLEVGP
jgi:4-hydroxymandelate oxidase